MDKKKHVSKIHEKYNKIDKESASFKCIFFKLRFQEEDDVMDTEEQKEKIFDEDAQWQNENLRRMQTNVLDMKEETDGMNLSEIIRLVFQEIGFQNEDEKTLQIVEYKLSELTLNSHLNGNRILLEIKLIMK